MNHTASPVPRTRHVTGRYTLMQSSYWASYCVILTFSSVYLLHQGFRNAEIGILISASGILSAVLQPVVSRAADNLRRMSLRQFAMVLLVVQTVFSGLLRVLTAPATQTVLYGCLLILLQLVLPLCSALGMDCLNRGIPLNFGVARGIGSVAYGVFSALCGRLVLWLGENSLPLAMLAINLVLLLSVATFRFRTPEAAGEGETSPKAEDTPADTRPFLRKYRGMVWILLGVVCLFISHNVLNTYAFQIVQPLGGTSEEMGTMLSIQAFAELPVMFGFVLLLKKASSRSLVRVCGVGFFLHALGAWVAPGMGVLYGVQIFEMPGYALYTLASIYWINDAVAPGDRVQGQAWFAMAMTLGNVLASFAGGLLLDYAGVSLLLAFATAAGGVGMVLLLVLLGKGRSCRKRMNPWSSVD